LFDITAGIPIPAWGDIESLPVFILGKTCSHFSLDGQIALQSLRRGFNNFGNQIVASFRLRLIMSPLLEETKRVGVLFVLAVVLAISPSMCHAADAEAAKDKLSQGPVPKYSPAGGVFSAPVMLKVASGVSGASVRYTLDGSEPLAKSETLSGELKLTATTLVRTRVFQGEKPIGPLASETYTLIEKELEPFTSNLPLVIINTFGREIERERKIPASVRFIDVAAGKAALIGEANFDGRGDVNLRGHTSLRYLKRSFALKTRDEAWESRSVTILGFPADNDWVLYAPYPDKTLLRDVLAYDLSRQLGRYATRTKFVELYLNQVGGRMSKRHYMGVYVLEEKLKRGKDRVKIQKLTATDNAEPNITGGYIFKKDHWDRNENIRPSVEGRPSGGGGSSGRRYGYPTGPDGFPADPRGFLPPEGGARRTRRTTESVDAGPNDPPLNRSALDIDILRDARNARPRGVPFQQEFRTSQNEEAFRTGQRNEFFYVEPKHDEITPAQKVWLQRHLAEFERALYGQDFKDPVKGYAAYIDADSFIDHHIIVELTKNIDGFRFSAFFHKDRGGKIKMEPIWDWNLSFGNANGKQGHIAEYWYWPQLDDTQYSYYRRLFDDPDFGQRYVDRMAEVRGTMFSNSNLMSRIDSMVDELGAARVRNFERWPILSRRIWPNTFVGKNYEDEINYMKDFIQRRLAWVDQQFISAPRASPARSAFADSPVTLTSAVGTIYYTLDGSDPRDSGGAISSKAKSYSAPFQLARSAKLFARVQHEDRWSAPLRSGVSGESPVRSPPTRIFHSRRMPPT